MDDRTQWKPSGIGDRLRRLLDQRVEQREAGGSRTTILNLRGHRHVVQVADLSESGVMILFRGDLADGDQVELQLLDQGPVKGQVRWVRDDCVGVRFARRGNLPADE